MFALKNTHKYKRFLLTIAISLIIVSTLSVFSIQLYPVSAQTPVANLTGLISDRGVDTDEDGVFNFLEIGVEVDVSSAGTFVVQVYGLSDSSFNYIDIRNSSTIELDVGIHVIYLSLNGSTIFGSGLDPAYVSGIYVSDESDNVLDQLTDVPLSTQYFGSDFQPPPIIIDIQFNEIMREIVVGQGESIHITNIYFITNNGDDIQIFEFGFPEDAYDVVLRDEMGNLEASLEAGTMTVNLRDKLYTNETAKLYLNYRLPWETYITQQNGLNYNLHFTFYEQFNWTIKELTVSIIFPEGAEFQSSNPMNPSSIEKSGLKDTVTFDFSDVTPEENLNFDINYRYLIFWSSFYPSIWVGVLVVIAIAFAFIWKAPKPITAPIIPVPPDELRRFVDAYEEKTRIQSELESMEEQLRKGKIPRRRFKVRKKMLDGRLSTISRELSSLHDKIRAAGSRYADMMRQIEVAETNLEGAERDIQRVESRYRRGEVSKGAYGKLMDEYKSRSEDAEAKIDGILLRLKEEIR